MKLFLSINDKSAYQAKSYIVQLKKAKENLSLITKRRHQ